MRHIIGLLVLLTGLCSFVRAFDHLDQEIFQLRDALREHESKDTTFYDFLGVSPDATLNEINKAFRSRSRTWHPDKNTKYKYATQRFARLNTVAEVLKSSRRERYDHFLKNGFPTWKGTGYYYNRFRPGLGTVLVLLYFMAGGFHYIFLRLTATEDRKRVRNTISDVSDASGFVPAGQKRKVTRGDVQFVVDDHQNVFLVDKDGLEWILDENEVLDPTIKDTLIVRLPLSLYRRSIGRWIITPSTEEEVEEKAEDVSAETSEEEKKPQKKKASASKQLANGKVISSASAGPGGRRRKNR